MAYLGKGHMGLAQSNKIKVWQNLNEKNIKSINGDGSVLILSTTLKPLDTIGIEESAILNTYWF